MNNIENIEIKRYKGDNSEFLTDIVIVEEILNIYVNGKHFTSLMYTPGDDENFIVGFLFCHGIIKEKSDIKSIEFRGENIVMVIISVEADENYSGIMAITSGCGGGSIRLNLMKKENISTVVSNYLVDHERIIQNMKSFNAASTLFKETGGVHGCALYSEEKLIIMKEDIGRHNAADKVIGEAVLMGINFDDKLLYTTGRVSSDIMLKAIHAGIPVLVSHSAPSNMAINLATAANITLVGFVRGDRMNIYSTHNRVY
jgi:FdhD protein